MPARKIRTIEKPCNQCNATGKLVESSNFVIQAVLACIIGGGLLLMLGRSMGYVAVIAFIVLVTNFLWNSKKECKHCGGTGRQTVTETIYDDD